MACRARQWGILEMCWFHHAMMKQQFWCQMCICAVSCDILSSLPRTSIEKKVCPSSSETKLYFGIPTFFTVTVYSRAENFAAKDVHTAGGSLASCSAGHSGGKGKVRDKARGKGFGQDRPLALPLQQALTEVALPKALAHLRPLGPEKSVFRPPLATSRFLAGCIWGLWRTTSMTGGA